MISFIDGLRELNQKMPYYWQSIEGLDTIMSDYFDINKFNLASDWTITIKTLETLDMRIYGLFSLLRNCLYDMSYYREVVPSNLQKFTMDIYVKDIRTFRTNSLGFKYDKPDNIREILNIENQTQFVVSQLFKDGSTKIEHSDGRDSVNADDLNRDYTGIIIHLDGCVFDIKSGTNILSTVSNNSVDVATNEIIIKAKSVEIKELIPWFKWTDLSKTSGNKNKEVVGDKWSDKLKRSAINSTSLQNAARDAARKFSRSIDSVPSKIIQSNVFGSVAGSLVELERGNLIGAIRRTGLVDLGYAERHPELPKINQTNNLGTA